MAIAIADVLPVTVTVWLVPVMVTGATLPIAVLLELTNVIDKSPPVQPAGIDASAIDVTTSSTTV